MTEKINVIDLFAGPGGLSEGFSAYATKNGRHLPFQTRMSVEKEESAHRTLRLRSLYRKLSTKKEKAIYHEYVQGRITEQEMKDLLPELWSHAEVETLSGPKALGKDNRLIHKRLRELKGSHKSEPWVVIGGPPCQAYSLVGRARNKGKKDYLPEFDNRHYLYVEYLKVLSIIEPDVFVMENVKGILSSKVKNKRIFPEIFQDLEKPYRALNKKRGKSYKIYSFIVPPDSCSGQIYDDERSFIIRSEEYGVPQARHRVILLGISRDIGTAPKYLASTSKVSIQDTLLGLPALRSRLTKQTDNPDHWEKAIQDEIAKMTSQINPNSHKPLLDVLEEVKYKLKKDEPTRSATYKPTRISKKLPESLASWLTFDMPNSVLNHEARGHMASDLGRYVFCSSWAKAFVKSNELDAPTPKAKDFPTCLAPNHKNWKSGKFADRFRVQVSGRPATTITSHISKDGHYFIHFDPTQCRSLTVREAARIQTFPDNYFFEGNRTEQYVQVGNAVPPYLAVQLAEVVYGIFAK